MAKKGRGGPRKANPGKRIGRPTMYGQEMTYQDVRIPTSWIAALRTAGDGNVSEGIRRAIQKAGIVG